MKVVGISIMIGCSLGETQENCITKEAMVKFCYYNYCVDSVSFVECGDYFKFKWGFLHKSGRLYLLLDTHVNYYELKSIITFRQDLLDTIFYQKEYIIKHDTLNLPVHIGVYSNEDTVVYLDYSVNRELIVMNLGADLGSLWFRRLLYIDSAELKLVVKTILEMKNYRDSVVPVYVIPKDYFVYIDSATLSSYEETCELNKIEEFIFSMRVRRIDGGYTIERYYIYPATYVTELPCF